MLNCPNSRAPGGECEHAISRADHLCRDNTLYVCPGWDEKSGAPETGAPPVPAAGLGGLPADSDPD